MGIEQWQSFIPLDKSWIIRMGVLDLLRGHEDATRFLGNPRILSDDLRALQRASEAWKTNQPIDVGESGTLYRFLQFASWKLGLGKRFVLHGTLKQRNITTDPSIVNLSLRELLTLDKSTSQWASAAVLSGNGEIIPNPPYKLQQTYEALRHWEERRARGLPWSPRGDETIARQAEAFLLLLQGERPRFIPRQAEDYCFARAFDYISPERAEAIWPSLRGHESDRVEEMERVLDDMRAGGEVTSRDHRAVQAVVLWGLVNKKEVRVQYPDAVKKSWPEFWQFVKAIY